MHTPEENTNPCRRWCVTSAHKCIRSHWSFKDDNKCWKHKTDGTSSSKKLVAGATCSITCAPFSYAQQASAWRVRHQESPAWGFTQKLHNNKGRQHLRGNTSPFPATLQSVSFFTPESACCASCTGAKSRELPRPTFGRLRLSHNHCKKGTERHDLHFPTSSQWSFRTYHKTMLRYKHRKRPSAVKLTPRCSKPTVGIRMLKMFQQDTLWNAVVYQASHSAPARMVRSYSGYCDQWSVLQEQFGSFRQQDCSI